MDSPDTHLAHPSKRNFYPKYFLYLKKSNFPNNKIFHTCLREMIFYPKKIFLIVIETFPNKELLYLSKKIISYTSPKKLKHFILDVFWISLCCFFGYFFMPAKLNKLTGVLTKNNCQSLFVKLLYFSIFYIFFYLNSNSLWFTSPWEVFRTLATILSPFVFLFFRKIRKFLNFFWYYYYNFFCQSLQSHLKIYYNILKIVFFKIFLLEITIF